VAGAETEAGPLWQPFEPLICGRLGQRAQPAVVAVPALPCGQGCDGCVGANVCVGCPWLLEELRV